MKTKYIAAGALICAACLCGGGALAYEAPEYGDLDNWLSLPANNDKFVDVFYLYPTAWMPMGEHGDYSEIDNAQMRERAAAALAGARGVFDGAANVYAPVYRQTGLSVLEMNIEDQEARIKAVPGQDALAAFEYYLKYYNEGRPFIIAGYSQGATTLKTGILEGYLQNNPDVAARMVAAYAVGYTINQDFLDANGLSFAAGAYDTGVVISWNTELPEGTANNPVVGAGALAINPISWTLTDVEAKAIQSLGASLNGVYTPGYANAYVNPVRGVVVCDNLTPEEYAKFQIPVAFPKTSLHGGDWNLYFYDFRQNVIDRSAAYFRPQYNSGVDNLDNARLAGFSAYLANLVSNQTATGERLRDTPFFHPLHQTYFMLASSQSGNAFKAGALRVYRELSPQATGQALAAIRTGEQAAADTFKNRLMTQTATSSLWSLWAEPFYHKGRQKGNDLNTSLNVEYKGAFIGAGMQRPNFNANLAVHFGKINFEGAQYDADADVAGFNAGFSRRFGFNQFWQPALTVYGGYTAYDFSQKRKVSPFAAPGNPGGYGSKPNINVWHAAVNLSNPWQTQFFILRPEAGLEYYALNMDGYREKGGELALKADYDKYVSLRSVLGLSVVFEAAKGLDLMAQGLYYHEFKDDRLAFTQTVANAPQLAYYGKGRSLGRNAGALGASATWRPAANLSFSANYDYYFSKAYSGNQISLKAEWGF